jgi:multiple sugar transport system substrate-binding protein
MNCRDAMHKTRRRAMGGAAALAGAMLAACGSGGRSEGIGPGGPPREKVVLSYPMWLSPQERATVDKASDALNAKFPTIEVKTESAAERDMIAKLITTVASGAPPDLAASNDKMFTEIALANAYADLTPFLNRDKAQVDVSDFYPVYLGATKLKGKQYGMPDYAGTGVFYYNRLLFERVGASLPDSTWTWDTFEELGRKLARDTDGDGKIDTFASNAFMEDIRWAHHVFWSVGGTIFDGFGPMLPRDTKVKVYSPQNVKALERYAKWASGQNIVPVPGQTQGDPWRDGKYALLAGGRTGVPTYKTFDWINKYGGMLLPPRGPAKPRSRSGVRYITMPRGVKYPDTSWEAIKFLSGKEGLTITMAEGRTQAVRKSLEETFEKTLQPFENAKVYQESARLYADPVPSPVQWYEHETLVKQHVQGVVQGKQTADTALRLLQEDIERTIKSVSQD